MTVAELVALLNEMPQDALAVVSGYESGYDDIGGVRRIVVKEKDKIWSVERDEWLKKKEDGETTPGDDLYYSRGPGRWDGWYDDTGKGFKKVTDGIEAVYIAENTDKNYERK